MTRLTAAWLLGLASLSACGSKVPPLTEREKTVVNELTTKMQPRCVGRYLVDLPFQVMEVGSAKIHGVTVTAKPQLLHTFELEMHRREAELKASKSTLGYPHFLFDHGKVRESDHTQYFVSLGNPGTSSDASRVIEAYKWHRGYQFSLQVKGVDWTRSVDKDKDWVKDMGTPNDVPQKTRTVFDLIERLQGRADNVIPTEPGTCFAGGFLPGKADSENEEISASFVMSERPDVSFDWDSFADRRDGNDTLLPRIRKAEYQETLKAAKGRILRLDSVDLSSGMKIDEALTQALSYAVPDVQGFQFTLETNYRGGALSPKILLDMETASPNTLIEAHQIKQSSLSEAEAVAIWDKVSRTLRPRPNAF